MVNVQIVLSALNKASGSIAKVKADIKQLGDSGKTAEGGVKGLGAALGGAWKTALAAAAAIAAVGAAVGKTYEIAKEGAELQYAEDRFNNLAIAAGTAADVLLTDMREATKGMMSDAELVASGADLMALGLAKSHDEVVRLTSVAGALKMNMNQLVLTLTNQTTMRFDALGVSVDGFQEKVKALEAAGLSANDAFKEAFLQQAEEQILKVGSAADSSIGAFQRMEASQANYFNALKQDLVEAGTWWAQFWEGVYNDKLEVRAYNALIEQANALGINTDALDQAVRGGKRYSTMMVEGIPIQYEANMVTADGIELNKAAVEALGEQVKYQTEMNAMRSRGTNANYEYSASEKLVAAEIANVRSEFQQQADKITTLDSTYKGIIDLGYKYSDTLAEINAKQAEYDAMPGWKKASKDGKQLLSDIEALKGSMKDLANQVTLDMFQATIAVGGVTAAELDAYMQMAIDMGLMSEEGAQAAITAYNNAIETINGYEIDEKTGNVNIDAVAAFVTLDLLQAYALKDKEARAIIKVQYEYGAPGDWQDEHDLGGPANPANPPGGATGMPVSAGKPYLWQEYGYRGEKFVPSQNGYILSRSDASRAVANAASQPTVDSGPSAQDIANAVKQGVKEAMRDSGGGKIYNLTMPTSSNPADVRTAFELMEAWA